MVTRIHSYLNIMYKYAGKEIDIMIEHFTNTTVYAVVIEDIIDTTVDKIKFHWNQNVILFLNRGATTIMNTEIWRRFLMARDEIFKTDEQIFISAVTVRELTLLSHSTQNWKNPSQKNQWNKSKLSQIRKTKQCKKKLQK